MLLSNILRTLPTCALVHGYFDCHIGTALEVPGYGCSLCSELLLL